VGGVVSLDRGELIDKIGSSLLYNIIFDAPSRNKLIFHEQAEDYLIEAFGSWKKSHPGFGYPSEDELAQLAKEENRPPFPRGVMRHLLKVGVSSVPEADFKNLIIQLVHMHPEDQEKHLLSNYAYLDKNMRNDMLTVAMRSRLFYSSCYALGESALPILITILNLIGQVIENDHISSPSLIFTQRELKSSRNIKAPLRDIYWRICMAVIVEGIYSDMAPERSRKYIRLYEVLRELWSNKVGIYLNITPTKDPIARSIDFNTDWDTFSNMIKAVIVGHYNYNYKREFKFGEKFIVADNSKFLCLKQFTRVIMSMCPKISKRIILTSLSKGRVLKKQVLTLEEGKPGVTGCPFYIPTEEGQEELTDGYYYDRDIHDDVEEDEDASREDLPEQAYVYTPCLDYIGITSKRGCAWNVYFAGETVSKDILAMCGEKVLYKKISYWNTLNDYVNPSSQYIFYLGVEGTKKHIEGYKRLTWEDTMKELVTKDCYIPEIVYEGKSYSWEKASRDPLLQSLFQGFDNYFKKIKTVEMDEEAVRMQDILTAHLQFENNPQLDAVRVDLRRYLERRAKKEEEKDNEQSVTGAGFVTFEEATAGINMKEIFDRVSEGIEAEQETADLKEYFVEKGDFFTYEEPMLTLTDVQLRSEVEAIFPGYQDKLLNRDIRLSKKTKARIEDYAKGKISQMQAHTGPRYRKLLLVVQAVLQGVEECNFLQNESLEFAAMIDDLFSQALETTPYDSGNIADLLPDTDIIRLELDLSKIL
jgi:predicted RNA-binding protein